MEEKRTKFRCPYCCELMYDDEVLFRSNTLYRSESELISEITNKKYSSRDDLEDDPDGILTPEERVQCLDKYHKYKVFVRGMSDKFDQFWKNYSGSTTEMPSPAIGEKCPNGWERPIIDPKNHDQTMEDSLMRDQDGFVYGVKDFKGETTVQRVCPRCHNPLPSTYGKYPTYFICVIGTSSAGKTVYLSQFLKYFEDVNALHGLTSMPLSTAERDYVMRNPVRMGAALPGGTPPQNLEQPLFYNIIKEKKNLTFVFYDIAGENCLIQSSMQKYGKFLEHSNGTIFIIDPKQIESLGIVDINAETDPEKRQKLLEKRHEPLDALQTMLTAFPGKNQIDVPIAVVISKSDMCEKQFGEDCIRLFQNDITPVYDSIKEAKKHPLFNAKEYNEIAKFLDHFMEKQEPNLYNVVEDNYSHHSFFAFSAIGCGVDSENKPIEAAVPCRIQEPFFWLLKEMGVLGTNAPVFPRISRAQAAAEIRTYVESMPKLNLLERIFFSVNTSYGKIRKGTEASFNKKVKEIESEIDYAFNG